MKPVILHKIFQPNASFDVQVVEVGKYREPIAIIDGFYKDPEAVRDFILDMPAPRWKTAPFGKNFLNYYDCRHTLDTSTAQHAAHRAMAALSRKYLKVEIRRPQNDFLTNVFQLAKDQPPNSITKPHHEGAVLNALICLNTDDECRGGTGFYRSRFNGVVSTREMTALENDAHDRWMDRSKLVENGFDYFVHDWEKYWQLEYLAEMKFNRLVMFMGTVFHGAHHTDNAFRDYPRVNQVNFFNNVRYLDPDVEGTFHAG